MTDKPYEFGVGEYTMRNGGEARVCFDLMEPAFCDCTKGGDMKVDDVFCASSWSKYGEHCSGIQDYDLMPPKRYVWASLYRSSIGAIRNSDEIRRKNSAVSATYKLRTELNDDGTINWTTAVILPIEEAKDVE
jgi:hypothetical protein